VRLRVESGPPLGVGDGESSETALTHGERFRFGASTWQVGAADVRVSDLIAGLGDRISRLASVERLEGFSLRAMFSEVLAKRSLEEIDEYFLVGTARTTPAITEVETGWPRPWLFGRILLFLGLVYFGFFAAVQQFGNPRLLPGLILMGSIAVPFTTLILFYELNTPRNVSFRRVLSLFFTGGVVSLSVSLVGFRLADLSWLGASSAGIVEEIGKLLTVVLIVRETKYRYQLNGLLFGAAVGAGFAAFESAGYAFWDALMTVGTLEATARLILVRGLLSPLRPRRLDRHRGREPLARPSRPALRGLDALRAGLSQGVLDPGRAAHALELAHSLPVLDQAPGARRDRLVRALRTRAAGAAPGARGTARGRRAAARAHPVEPARRRLSESGFRAQDATSPPCSPARSRPGR